MNSRSFLNKLPLLAALLGTSAAALAHHSFAMFDRTKETVVKGTVRQFQWTNPHSYLDVLDTDGKITWTLELGGVTGLIHQGFKKNIFKPGDTVTLHVSPLRNGAPGGLLLSAQKADGTVYKFNDDPTS